jgi:hypothetical protein
MRIGIGGEAIAVEERDPPVHCRVGGQAGFDGEDVVGEIAIAFIDGIETRLRAEGGKPRRPDMRRDEKGMRPEIIDGSENNHIAPANPPKATTAAKGDFSGVANLALIVSPSLDKDGRQDYSTRGQLFDARVDGRLIVKRSTTPFCDACRVLLAEGIAPGTPIVMRHGYDGCDALKATVGVAAKLTVSDDRLGKPIFTKHKPYDGPASTAVSPPISPAQDAGQSPHPAVEVAP